MLLLLIPGLSLLIGMAAVAILAEHLLSLVVGLELAANSPTMAEPLAVVASQVGLVRLSSVVAVVGLVMRV